MAELGIGITQNKLANIQDIKVSSKISLEDDSIANRRLDFGFDLIDFLMPPEGPPQSVEFSIRIIGIWETDAFNLYAYCNNNGTTTNTFLAELTESWLEISIEFLSDRVILKAGSEQVSVLKSHGSYPVSDLTTPEFVLRYLDLGPVPSQSKLFIDWFKVERKL